MRLASSVGDKVSSQGLPQNARGAAVLSRGRRDRISRLFRMCALWITLLQSVIWWFHMLENYTKQGAHQSLSEQLIWESCRATLRIFETLWLPLSIMWTRYRSKLHADLLGWKYILIHHTTNEKELLLATSRGKRAASSYYKAFLSSFFA